MSDTCELCGHTLLVGDFPFCPHDSTRPRQNFISCEVEIDGVTHRISSIQDANRLEREYAQRAASDPSVSPISFRAFHQNQSNQDQNCFGPSPQVPIPKSAKLQARRHGRADPRPLIHEAVRRIYGKG